MIRIGEKSIWMKLKSREITDEQIMNKWWNKMQRLKQSTSKELKFEMFDLSLPFLALTRWPFILAQNFTLISSWP